MICPITRGESYVDEKDKSMKHRDLPGVSTIAVVTSRLSAWNPVHQSAKTSACYAQTMLVTLFGRSETTNLRKLVCFASRFFGSRLYVIVRNSFSHSLMSWKFVATALPEHHTKGCRDFLSRWVK